MGRQEQKNKTSSHDTRDEKSVEVPDEQNVTSQEISDDTEDLLDEIDDVLEENAEDFVRNYIQKGGE